MNIHNLTYHNFLSSLNISCNCAGFGCDHVDYFEECNNHAEETYAQGRQGQIAHWLNEHPDPVKFLLSCGYELRQVGTLLKQVKRVIDSTPYNFHQAGFPVFRAPLDE